MQIAKLLTFDSATAALSFRTTHPLRVASILNALSLITIYASPFASMQTLYPPPRAGVGGVSPDEPFLAVNEVHSSSALLGVFLVFVFPSVSTVLHFSRPFIILSSSFPVISFFNCLL